MTDPTELADRYIACWNEANPARRQVLIAQTWSGDASYLDPVMQGEGQEAIDALIRGVQERFPGHRFRRTSKVDAHNDRLRFSWDLGPEGGPALVDGTDFAVLAADGKLRTVTGFFDRVPTPS
jgi:hypothetical protein